MQVVEQVREASGFDICDVLSDSISDLDATTFDLVLAELVQKCLEDASFRQDLGDFGGLEVILTSAGKTLENEERLLSLLKRLKPILHGSKTNKDVLRECGFLTLLTKLTFRDASIDLVPCRFLCTAVSGCDENRKVVGNPGNIATLVKLAAGSPATSETFVVSTDLVVKLCTQDDSNKASPVGVWCRDQIAEDHLEELLRILTASRDNLPRNQKTFFAMCCCFSSKTDIVTRLTDELHLLDVIEAACAAALDSGGEPKTILQVLKLMRNLAFTDILKVPIFGVFSKYVIEHVDAFLTAPFDHMVMSEMIFGISAVLTLHSADIAADIWNRPAFPDFLRVNLMRVTGKALLQCLQLVRNSARHGVAICDSVVAVIRDGDFASKADCARTQTLVGEILRIDERKKAEAQ